MERESKGNILEDVLGVDRLTALFKAAVLLKVVELDHNSFFFRGDTLSSIAELVQDSMFDQLHRADLICSRAVVMAPGEYPIPTPEILVFQNEIVTLGHYQGLLPSYMFRRWFVSAACKVLPKTLRRTIVRRLSHRAGVVQMANQAYDLVWGSLVHTIVVLLRPAMLELTESKKPNAGEKRLLAEGSRLLARGETRRCIRLSRRAGSARIAGLCHTCKL